MADPFSISASIAGLIGLVDVIFIKTLQCRKHLKLAKNADDDVKRIADQISAIAGTLKRLELLAQVLDDEPFDETPSLGVVIACDRTPNKFSQWKGKLLWPFSVEETKDLLADLSRHQNHLQLAISADSMNGLLLCLSRQEFLGRAMAKMEGQVERISDIVVRVEISTKRQKVRDFFLKVNPQEALETNLRLRYPMTGIWIRNLASYQRWLDSLHCRLWLSGIPGAGKSVLAGTLIEDALQRSGTDTAVAYFFCDYQNQETLATLNILSTIIAQISLQSPRAFDIVEEYYDELHPPQSLEKGPHIVGLQRILQETSYEFERVLIVVDGIDEANGLITELLPSLLEILTCEKISLALISRDEVATREVLEGDFSEISVAATGDDVKRYVTGEIETRVRSRRLRNIGIQMKEEILECLLEGACGMFRWVACQMDYLCEFTTDKRRREALQNLPRDLPESYHRILERVPKSNEDMVITTLSFIAYAQQPLNIEQLREVVSVPPLGERLEVQDYEPTDEILRACSSLIRKSPDGKRLTFAHASVRQYLESGELLRTSLNQYHLNPSNGSRIMATRCLRLLQVDNFVRPALGWESELQEVLQRHKKFTFYEHASAWWPEYAYEHMRHSDVKELSINLLRDGGDGAYTAWMTSFSLRAGLWAGTVLSDYGGNRFINPTRALTARFLAPTFTPLHMAALLGMSDLCRQLVTGIEIQSSTQLSPLDCAVMGPQLFASQLFFAEDNVDIDADLELWGGWNNFWLYMPLVEIQKTVQVLLGTERTVGELTTTRIDHLLATVVNRASFEHAIVLGVLPDIITTLGEAAFKVLKSGAKLSAAIHQCRKLEPWLFCDIKDMQTTEDSFRRLIELLNSFSEPHSIATQLCTLVWESALAWNLPFARDSFFVKSTISFTVEALVTSTFTGVEQDRLAFVQSAIKDPRIDPTSVISNSLSLLEVAVEYASLNMVQLLVEAGCSAAPRPDQTSGPKHMWALRGKFINKSECELILRLLLRHGASTLEQDDDGDTAWHIACDSPSALEALFAIEDEDIITKAMSIENNNRRTVLAHALEGQNESCVLLIISHITNDPEYSTIRKTCFQL
ncbi:hypothetical protein JX265_009455 [Neoarthrinium moseri]|uniref:Nephrocystin 3-like N-terminal domain-containing protein n=1 Tax=Neoarthrinium moseri TaxID=1658444 RepID=A0A9P9WG53_9PEZI|nr:hypothetical protein JX265_009455 [Neoarthrinium moseri]